MPDKSVIYDIVIIGSGPAACSAAICSWQAGMETLIVCEPPGLNKLAEKGIESLHPGIYSLLEKLGIQDIIEKSCLGRYSGIEVAGTFTSHSDSNDENWEGWHIERSAFDALLLEHVKNLGIPVLEESAKKLVVEDDCVIGLETTSTKIISRYTIDASGATKFGGRQLQFQEMVFSPTLIATTGITENMDLNDPVFKGNYARFIPESNGWLWLAPIIPDKYIWTKMEVKGSQNNKVPIEFINGRTDKIIAKNVQWRIFNKVCTSGIILCGDAAGIIDPAASQGILNALYSSVKAVDTVQKCLHDPDLENDYLKVYSDWFYENYSTKTADLTFRYSSLGINVLEKKSTDH